MEFYNQCRSRDKSKEIQGPLRLKLISSYDRIKSEMEVRGAVPGQVAHENWDVIPVIRKARNQLNRQATRNTDSMRTLPQNGAQTVFETEIL